MKSDISVARVGNAVNVSIGQSTLAVPVGDLDGLRRVLEGTLFSAKGDHGVSAWRRHCGDVDVTDGDRNLLVPLGSALELVDQIKHHMPARVA